MPRRPRCCPAGTVFQVLNGALFDKPQDFEAFVRVLVEAHEREPLPIFAYVVMPNHWHFVARPPRHFFSRFRPAEAQERASDGAE